MAAKDSMSRNYGEGVRVAVLRLGTDFLCMKDLVACFAKIELDFAVSSDVGLKSTAHMYELLKACVLVLP
jgi:hypothetical protein